MHIKLHGVHIEITDAIRSYANEKMSSLAKFTPKGEQNLMVAVTLSKTTGHHIHGDVFSAEAELHLKGKDFYVRSQQNDLYACIDEIRDMLARDLASHKDRQFSLFKKGALRLKQLLKFSKEDK
jgi:putative sigma-54 modulation protein